MATPKELLSQAKTAGQPKPKAPANPTLGRQRTPTPTSRPIGSMASANGGGLSAAAAPRYQEMAGRLGANAALQRQAQFNAGTLPGQQGGQGGGVTIAPFDVTPGNPALRELASNSALRGFANGSGGPMASATDSMSLIDPMPPKTGSDAPTGGPESVKLGTGAPTGAAPPPKMGAGVPGQQPPGATLSTRPYPAPGVAALPGFQAAPGPGLQAMPGFRPMGGMQAAPQIDRMPLGPAPGMPPAPSPGRPYPTKPLLPGGAPPDRDLIERLGPGAPPEALDTTPGQFPGGMQSAVGPGLRAPGGYSSLAELGARFPQRRDPRRQMAGLEGGSY